MAEDARDLAGDYWRVERRAAVAKSRRVGRDLARAQIARLETANATIPIHPYWHPSAFQGAESISRRLVLAGKVDAHGNAGNCSSRRAARRCVNE